MADTTRDSDPIIIKKYANRRLYNTATSSYVTLEHLAEMVRSNVDFQVLDAKTGEDITRSVLTHIIVEAENKGENMLPLDFLRQLISLYGDSLQSMVPGYLDQAMKSFSGNQDQIREMMEKAFGVVGGAAPAAAPLKAFEDMARKNMDMFENAMKSFNPMAGAMGGMATGAQDKPKQKAAENEGEMDALRSQLDQLQKQIDELSKKG